MATNFFAPQYTHLISFSLEQVDILISKNQALQIFDLV